MMFFRGTQEQQVLTPDLEAVNVCKPFLLMSLGILSKPVIFMSHVKHVTPRAYNPMN